MKSFITLMTLLPVVVYGLKMVPPQHHHRFLQEIDVLKDELSAWKQSAAGQEAVDQGFYDANKIMDDHAQQDELERFFMTKLGIEEVSKLNPEAEFSIETPFSLMTEDEFAAFVGDSFHLKKNPLKIQTNGVVGDSWMLQNTTSVHVHDADNQAVNMDVLASSKDWSTSGNCVAPVKNQGRCGSCWAFASVGALESAFCLKNGKLTLFSEQQVTSCDKRSSGCRGGWPTSALNYVKNQASICLAEAYPYTSGSSGNTGTCTDAKCSKKQSVAIKSVVTVAASTSAFVTALNQQPVSVAVAAGNRVWMQYKRGVVTSCSSNRVDHAVLAVGYGTASDGVEFIKIKNSWGSTWGDNGYMQLKRGENVNTCGLINKYATYPTL